MTENNIKNLLIALNYKPKNGTNNIYIKNYTSNENYNIEVDFNEQKIYYGDKINLGNTTTSNFSKPENFVVLECVNRLLEKGYKPENIELEKIYPSGRGHSGNLDILVYDENHKAYLMIECKTVGTEHTKEHNKMIKDGGQLFSYYALDRDAQYLCLYSSILDDKNIEYKNDIIPVEDEWKTLSTSKEIHVQWNKSFKDNGIFEKHATPYQIKHKTLTYEMLIDLKETDSGKIFNQIMEILRHNVVSDKPNAFNKLLNLFVCKIIDENRNAEEELKFQWLDNDTDETLQMRLNDLYKEGMWRFLNINVTDYSEDEVNSALQGVQATDDFKQTIRDMFRDTRLKKSPNFAFKEVLDEKSFRANAKIVKEIVNLLQGYKFRYRQKHQFLGDFFELLLNTSMKQESGQYFTPVPITRFIISSLPIKELIINKIKNNDNEILPVTIDYATGSGHFLTEYMEQVQTIIEDLGNSLNLPAVKTTIDNLDISMATPTVKNKIKTWIDSEKFIWAKDYVYGIELDDRLVKTAKVSAFFNGDGEANIIWANGLDNFEKSTEYIGKLRSNQKFDKKNNGQFDILISNPPYSVEAFKTTLKNGDESFELYHNLTDNSSEIECLFVERMKQLLKVGGWAGLVLPTSILSNSGIHSKAREIIFKYFKIKSIVELGSGTFMKTGNNTIILFLERRVDGEYKEIEIAIDKFFNDTLDVTVLGTEKVFSKYVANVYENLAFEDYIKIINGQEVEHELYKDYQKEFNKNWESIKQLEKEKILYFILTYDQETVIIKTGKKQEEKKFLGYEFSERRGHEGLKWLPNGTKLYNENQLLDSTKANSYIYNAFNGLQTEIDKSLSKNISYRCMSELFEYGTSKFDKKINLNKYSPVKLCSKYPLRTIKDYIEELKIINGYSFKSENFRDSKENIEYLPVLKIANIKGETVDLSSVQYHNSSTFDNYIANTNSLAISLTGGENGLGRVGKVAWLDEKVLVNQRVLVIEGDYNKLNYLYANINTIDFLDYVLANSSGSGQKNISADDLLNYKIPLPPIEIQQTIVSKIGTIESEYSKLNNDIALIQQEQDDIIGDCFNDNIMKKIGNYTILVKRGKSTKYGKSNIQIIKSGQARGYEKFDFTNKHYVSNNFVSDERNLIKEDLLINSTGVGTAGRVTLFNLDGNYVVDSHITIIRLNKKELLPKFALYSLAHIGFKTIEEMATGQSGQIELSVDTIKEIKIPLPTIDVQQKIVSEIEKKEKIILEMQNKIDKLELSKKQILEKYLS